MGSLLLFSSGEKRENHKQKQNPPRSAQRSEPQPKTGSPQRTKAAKETQHLTTHSLRSESVTFLKFASFLTYNYFVFNITLFAKSKKSQPLSAGFGTRRETQGHEGKENVGVFFSYNNVIRWSIPW
jgi:hypothetical protein